MNHQPFEDWLLDDEPLTLQQERELQSHLRGCRACSGIADSNMELHSGRMISPAPGFADRFQPRLTAWRAAQLRQQALGTVVLVVVGVALLYVLAGPAMLEAIRSPAAWLGGVTGMIIEVLTLASVLGRLGNILLRHVPSILTSGFKLELIFAAVALGCLWTLTMRRLARSPQGA